MINGVHYNCFRNFRMDRIKLLIVSNTLPQAGSERWIYEICKHIDKQIFDVGILCNEMCIRFGDKPNFNNYYYLKIKELGLSMYPIIEADDGRTYLRRSIDKILRGVKKAVGKNGQYVNPRIARLFKEYDVVCVQDFFNYRILKEEANRIQDNKFFIVLHSHKLQFSYDPYRCFDKERIYNFTYICPKQISEIASSNLNIDKNNFFYNPLVINLTDYPNLFNSVDDTLVISVFTRISSMKPIDQYLKAFELVQKQSAHNCRLNIYGEIQQEEYFQQMQRLVEDLSIKEMVHFMGHSSSIAETVRKDKINVCWSSSTNTNIGYASIELGAFGVPCFHCNAGEDESSQISEQTGGAILTYNKINDFVEAFLKYASHNESLAALSAKQREYMMKNHNIGNKIKDFENYVISIKNSGEKHKSETPAEKF